MALPKQLSAIFQYIDENQENFLKSLQEALSITSITNEGEAVNPSQIIEWTNKQLRSHGFLTNLKNVEDDSCDDPTTHPRVIFANLDTGNCPNKTTVLIYSHLYATSTEKQDTKYYQADQNIHGKDVLNLSSLISWLNTLEAFKNLGIDYPVDIKFIIAPTDTELSVGMKDLLNSEKDSFLGYKCSAGIAHNKILAKLVCGLHKPNKQTILPQGAVPQMFANLPIRKIKSLGGKFGHILSETLNINYIGELLKFSEKELVQRFDEKNGRWLYNISRGIDRDPVQVKLISKSIGCCKRFPGRTSLCKADEVEHWMKELSGEISDRLEEDLKENNRRGRLMTISFSQMTNQTEISSTRAVPLKSYKIEKICQQAMEVLIKYCQKTDGSFHITFLGLSIGNFEDIKNVKTITSYFNKVDKVLPDLKKTESVNVCHQTNSDHMIRDGKSGTPSSKTEIKTTKSKIEDAINKNYVQESDISDCDENSVYSNTTIELEEYPEDLIFYDDSMRSKSIENQIIASHKATNDGYMGLTENKVLRTNASTSLESSFESGKYSNDFSISTSPVLGSRTHDDNEDEIDSSKEIERDFDTSKIFNGYESSDDESLENIAPTEGNCKFVGVSENCKECGDLIPIVDIVSHMDYHLALKLSQEIQAGHSKIVDDKQKLNGKPPNKKRKVSDSFGTIQLFYKKQEFESNEVTELCTECNKRIRIDDLVTHYDYHAAKKLHLELNSPSSKSENINNKISVASSSVMPAKRNKKKVNNGVNIASFFKPIDS